MNPTAPTPTTPTTSLPKYPKVRVRLSGLDGNAFSVIGRCRSAAQKAGIPGEEISAFSRECMKAGSYSTMLAVCADWFDVF